MVCGVCVWLGRCVGGGGVKCERACACADVRVCVEEDGGEVTCGMCVCGVGVLVLVLALALALVLVLVLVCVDGIV